MSRRSRLAKLEESFLGSQENFSLITVEQFKWVAEQVLHLPFNRQIEETSRLYKELGIWQDTIDDIVARMCRVGKNQGWLTEKDVKSLKL